MSLIGRKKILKNTISIDAL